MLDSTPKINSDTEAIPSLNFTGDKNCKIWPRFVYIFIRNKQCSSTKNVEKKTEKMIKPSNYDDNVQHQKRSIY